MKSEYPAPHAHYYRLKLIEIEIDLINWSIKNVDWTNLFLGKNVPKQVEIFNEGIINIFHNFIPNKLFFVMTKTLPGWMKKSNH